MSDFCDPMCPFLGCASCAYSGGEIPAAATESAPVSGVASGKMALDIEAAPASAQTLPRPRPTAGVQANRSDVQA